MVVHPNVPPSAGTRTAVNLQCTASQRNCCPAAVYPHAVCAIMRASRSVCCHRVPHHSTKGGLWTGKFVNRDYCRFTSDRSPVTYRPERISSLTKSRNVVWKDLLDVALSEFVNVAVSRQVDRWLATKASVMDLPVNGATVEELERVKLLRTAGRLGDYFLAADNTGEIPP